jgi:hypothetical protein
MFSCGIPKARKTCKFISGELKAGGISYVYVLLERSYDSPEGHPGQHAYNFTILILLTDLTSVSIFSVCFYSRYLSLWYSPCADVSSPLRRRDIRFEANISKYEANIYSLRSK